MDSTKRNRKDQVFEDQVAAADHEIEDDKAANILHDQIISNYVCRHSELAKTFCGHEGHLEYNITDGILDFLPVTDILSCSLVSRTVATLARDFIRRRRNCLINCNLRDLQGLQERRNLLENDILNYGQSLKGFYFDMRAFDFLTAPYFQILTCLEAILKKVPTTYVTIALKEDCFNYEMEVRTCFLKFLREQEATNKIEHLRILGRAEIFWTELNTPNTTEPILDGFANLKTFQSDFLPLAWSRDKSYAEFLQGCPNLTEFNAAVDVKAMHIFDKFNKLPLLRWLHLYHSNVDEKLLQRMNKLNVPLQVLSLEDYNWTPELIYWIRRIVQVNTKSMEKIVLVDVVSLTHIEIEPMETIREVVVLYPRNYPHFGYSIPDPEILAVFPNAKITY